MSKINLFSIFSLALISCNVAFAQKSQLQIARNSIGKLQVAINNKEDNKKQLSVLGEGIKAAEAAQNDKKTKKWPETWAIKAYLSSYVSILDENTSNSDRYYGLTLEAIDSARRLDKFQANARLIAAAVYNTTLKKQQKAQAAFESNDFPTAFELFKQISDFFPTDTTLALNTAIAAQSNQNFDQAIVYYKRAKDNGIKNPTVYQKLSSIYNSKFEKELAIKTLEEGIRVNAFNVNLTNDHINLLLDNEKYAEATKAIESSIKVDTKNKLLYFLYGYLQQNNKNNSTAILAYNKALNIDENYFEALFQTGLAYVDTANEMLKSSKQEDKDKFVSYINRAELALLQAHEINQNDKSTVQLLIDIYTRKNKLDKVQELRGKLEEF